MLFYIFSPDELRTFIKLQDATKCAAAKSSRVIGIDYNEHLKSVQDLNERIHNQNLEIASLKDEIDRLTAIK